ncbi:MAG: type II toxin-antitoxin system RelE/ParE family toxin [Cyclobacteriaceae bacterium]|nr:type II toxin-antitoxin system RelE/ParE family toxin [Cyclobacteriaceae bacterium]
MKSGYKLLWSDRALSDLQNIINYLTENWSEKEIQNFARRLDKRLDLISINPALFPKTSKKKNVRDRFSANTLLFTTNGRKGQSPL